MEDKDIQRWLDAWEKAGLHADDLAELLAGAADLWTPDSDNDESAVFIERRRLAGIAMAASRQLRK